VGLIAKLIDKAVLMVWLLSMVLKFDNLFIPVTVTLSAAAVSTLVQAIENVKIKSVIMISYMVFMLFAPELIFMFPIVFYEVVYSKNKAALTVSAVSCMYAVSGLSLVYLASVLTSILFSALLAIKTKKLEQTKKTLIETRDAGIEVKYLLELKNKDLIERQDYEIYLAKLKERNRISREIHDNVGHLLTRSILQLGAMLTINNNPNEKHMLEELKKTLDSAMTRIRESVHNLHDESIDLKQSIREILDSMKENYETSCELNISEAAEINIKMCFLSVIKEAMSNILKHSNCTAIKISLQEHPAFYQLIVEDNGTDIHISSEKGMGLFSMRERIEKLNGIINISSEKGFKIFISVPKNKKGFSITE